MAAPTALAVTVDLEEYSRFERDKDTVDVRVTPTGTNLAGELVTVELIKARRARDIVVATKTLILVDDGEHAIQFDLNEIVDNEEVPKVRRGSYLMRATSVSVPSVTADSEDFLVSLITVDRLRSDYAHGTDQRASDVLTVHEQPQKITGVTVIEVSKGHPQSWTTLSYTINSDGGTGFIRTLSWCDGPVVVLTPDKKTYTLRRGNGSDWIRVRVTFLSALPTVNTAEDLLIETAPLDEERIRGLIEQAISWVEESELFVFLEPTRLITQPNAASVTFPTGTDIPVFSGADWDCIVDAVSYNTPAAGHWINFQMPYRPLIRFDELFGQVSNTRIVDIATEWIEVHERGAFTELVPFNQEIAFNFIGLIWVEALRGPVPLPNFWNFDALAGYRKTPPVLLELVAKKAHQI